MEGSFLRRSWKYNLGTLKIIPRTLQGDHNHPSIAIKSRNLYCCTLLVSSSLELSGITETTTNWDCWRAETDEQATKVGSASFYLLVVPWSGLTRIMISQKAEIRGQLTADIFPPDPPLPLPVLHCAHTGPGLSSPSCLCGQQRKSPWIQSKNRSWHKAGEKWETRLINFHSPDKDCKGPIFHFNVLSIRKTVPRGLVFV